MLFSEKETKIKEEQINKVIKDLDKRFGKGTLIRMGDRPDLDIETISSGSISVDIALGIGGYPRGRIIEIYGPESSGKTTIALHAIASAQKNGGTAAFIDAEHALDPSYAEKLGIDINELYLSQPDTGEQALEITEALVRSGAVDVIVIDSVAALVPKSEIEGAMGDSHVGRQARLMSQALRKIAGAVHKTNCLVIFINQLREKIGVLFGSPETTTGGRALKFFASVRLDVRRIETIKQKDQFIGNRTRIKIVKNKVSPPFKDVEVEILYGQGISYFGELLTLAVANDIIVKSGSWFSYNDENIGQGRENTIIYLGEHPEMAKEIDVQIRNLEKVNLKMG